MLTGDYKVDASGSYVRSTVAAPRDERSAIVRQEVFGPMVTAAPFSGIDEAVALANDTDYGLAAMV